MTNPPKQSRKALDCLFSFLKPRGFLAGLFFLSVCLVSGCGPATYSEERVHEALREIAAEEYNIPDIKVEFAGKTMGVFLPLDELFVMDFKEALMSGKVTDMQQLFQPTEAAMTKVEDILFSMSRVMLSTDRDIDFYYLQATDIEKTGMELSFLGHVDDIKKVRFWDIPRSEYRKRVIHDFQLNRPTLWHRPVRQFFKDLGEKDRIAIQEKYLKGTPEVSLIDEFFFADAGGVLGDERIEWEVLEIKSLPIEQNEAMVYVKVRGTPQSFKVPARTSDYLFQVSSKKDKEEISRIIPMQLMDQISETSQIPLNKELIYQSLELWENEFKMPDMTLGEFIAIQLTRRLQYAAAADERIQHTFSGVKLLFKYESKKPGFFSLFLTAPLKGSGQKAYTETEGIHEDILYIWELAAREFVNVIRAYRFKDWEYLEFELVEAPGYLWTASKQDLERFRKKKRALQDILTLTAV